MSGDEKTTGEFANPAIPEVKSGYAITPKDAFSMQIKLQNMQEAEKHIWVTISYEYLPGNHFDYKKGKTLWLSIGMLGAITGLGNNRDPTWGATNLTMKDLPKKNVSSENSFIWTAPRDGVVLSTGGYLHPGGTSLQIFKEGNSIYDSVARYGSATGSIGGHGGSGGHGAQASDPGLQSIEKQVICFFKEGHKFKKGEKMWI
jgi:hypothetical protein